MTDLRQAAQQALEALGKWSSGRDMDAVELNDLIATLEAALEQQEQEPVAWIRPSGKAMLDAGGYCTVYASEGMSNYSAPLYTTPPRREWRGLSDEEILLISVECAASHQQDNVAFARAIKAALKEKNNG